MVLTFEEVTARVYAGIREVIGERARTSELEMNTLLLDPADRDDPSLRLDSFQILELMVMFEDSFQIEFPDEIDPAAVQTVGDICVFIHFLTLNRGRSTQVSRGTES